MPCSLLPSSLAFRSFLAFSLSFCLSVCFCVSLFFIFLSLFLISLLLFVICLHISLFLLLLSQLIFLSPSRILLSPEVLDINDDAEFLTQGVSTERVQEIMKQAMANNRGKVKDAETLQSYICQADLKP